jgi:hypothetical protein
VEIAGFHETLDNTVSRAIITVFAERCKSRSERHLAQVAELVDAPGSGPGGGNTVEVRVLSWAPKTLPDVLFEALVSSWSAENSRKTSQPRIAINACGVFVFALPFLRFISFAFRPVRAIRSDFSENS